MRLLIGWFVDRPLVVNITTIKAGAGPEEVELGITLPLEEELLDVECIKKIYSNSMESLSVKTLNLDLVTADKQDILRDSGGSIYSFLEKKIVTVGQFRDPRDVETAVVRSGALGNTVLLRDVATVVADYEDWDVQSRLDRRVSIALQACRKALADEVHTAASGLEFVEGFSVLAGAELVMVADISRLTATMLDVLGGNAILGLVSVLLLLCYFLELCFALWVAVGIPFAV